MALKLQINTERIVRELEQLASYSETPPPAITRILFTRPDLEARSLPKGAVPGSWAKGARRRPGQPLRPLGGQRP
ncbi:MAG: hypothetical protein RML14_05190 [Meiothermus sp.]|uniref:hypothetical protein n=1 Tax=Meiothermus sp. TaxID=1955249 RepID=UPI00298F0ACB|nr:hypothetical protein [Meiothermus sp.]MDW8481273.1 hypothetical protein [Meiothermus sp.]